MCGQLGERTVANLAAVNDLVWGLQWGGEVGFSHIYLSLELVLICSRIVQGKACQGRMNNNVAMLQYVVWKAIYVGESQTIAVCTRANI